MLEMKTTSQSRLHFKKNTKKDAIVKFWSLRILINVV